MRCLLAMPSELIVKHETTTTPNSGKKTTAAAVEDTIDMGRAEITHSRTQHES